MNSWYNLRIMSKRPGNSLNFFLSKQTRVENDLSSENELDESLTIAKNNSQNFRCYQGHIQNQRT